MYAKGRTGRPVALLLWALTYVTYLILGGCTWAGATGRDCSCPSVVFCGAVEAPAKLWNKALAESGFAFQPKNIPIFEYPEKQKKQRAFAYGLVFAFREETCRVESFEEGLRVRAWGNGPPVLWLHARKVGIVDRLNCFDCGLFVVEPDVGNPTWCASMISYQELYSAWHGCTRFDMHKHPCPLNAYQSIGTGLCCVRADGGAFGILNSCIRGLFCKRQGITHIFRLSVHRAPLPEHEPYESTSEDGVQPRVRYGPPIYRRFWCALVSGLLLIPGCYYGTALVDAGRKRLGRLLIGVCFGLFWSSLGLIWVSGFAWSWGWWL